MWSFVIDFLHLFSKSVHVAACISAAFLFMTKQSSVTQIHCILFIHSSADRHLHGLNNLLLHRYTTFCLSIHQLIDICMVCCFLAITKNVAVNFQIKFLCGHVFISLGYKPRSAIAGIYADSMLNILKNCQVAPLYLFTSSVRDLMLPHPRQPCLLSVFLIVALPVGLIVVFICISVMANDVEPLSTCFLAICRSSWALRLLKFHGVQCTPPLS